MYRIRVHLYLVERKDIRSLPVGRDVYRVCDLTFPPPPPPPPPILSPGNRQAPEGDRGEGEEEPEQSATGGEVVVLWLCQRLHSCPGEAPSFDILMSSTEP